METVQVFVHGRTTRSFLVALIVPHVGTLRNDLSNEKVRHRISRTIQNWRLPEKFQGHQSLLALSDEDLLENDTVRDFVLRELEGLGRKKQLTSIERVRSVRLVKEVRALSIRDFDLPIHA